MKKVFNDIVKNQKKNQVKGRHHFVPEVYLKRFYDPEINQIYRGEIAYKSIKKFTAGQIFYVYKLYDLKLFKHTFLDIENFYGGLESEIGKMYVELDNVKDLRKIEDEETKSDIFFFLKMIILTQYFRTKDIHPAEFRETCQNLVSLYESKESYLKIEFPFIKKEQLRLLEKIITRGVKKDSKYANEVIKGIQYSILPILLSDFSASGITLARTKEKKYITSDKPVACSNLDDLVNFKNFIYPLSPNLLVYGLGDKITKELIQDTQKVNDYLFNNAIEYVISHDKNNIIKYFEE